MIVVDAHIIPTLSRLQRYQGNASGIRNPGIARGTTPLQATPNGSHQSNKYVYEATYGLPIVHKTLKYSELLRAIREEQIDEVAFFTQRGHEFLEGPCLVRFKDTNQVAQAVFPPNDARLSYAMEAHDVRGYRLPTPPTRAELQPPK